MALPTLSTFKARANRAATRDEKQSEMEETISSIGYTSTGRATGNKFVEVRGTTDNCLVANYGARFGGHQIEAGSAAGLNEMIATLKAAGVSAKPAINGWDRDGEEIPHRTRVGVGGKDNLKRALQVLIGEPKAAVQTTTEALTSVAVDDDIALIAAAAKAKREREAAAKVDPREADIAKLKALGFEQVDIDAALKAKYGA